MIPACNEVIARAEKFDPPGPGHADSVSGACYTDRPDPFYVGDPFYVTPSTVSGVGAGGEKPPLPD